MWPMATPIRGYLYTRDVTDRSDHPCVTSFRRAVSTGLRLNTKPRMHWMQSHHDLRLSPCNLLNSLTPVLQDWRPSRASIASQASGKHRNSIFAHEDPRQSSPCCLLIPLRSRPGHALPNVADLSGLAAARRDTYHLRALRFCSAIVLRLRRSCLHSTSLPALCPVTGRC